MRLRIKVLLPAAWGEGARRADEGSFARPLMLLLVAAIAAPCAMRAQQIPPREIWPQATSAAREGDLESARKKADELVSTGRAYGLKTYPLYASSAAALARQATTEKKPDVAEWASRTATALDAKSSAVSFSMADIAAAQNNWAAAIPIIARGIGQLLMNYRTRVLSRADLLIVLALAIAVTAVVFSLVLFIRYGRSMAHDFREILGRRIRGGTVSVLAFALLFLPIFLWLGPMWLVLYWFVIFFGYASARERTFIIVLGLLVAALPLVLELSANWIAGVDSPVVMSAISGSEQAYQPEALRRLQELVALVPDNPTLHILLGNLQVFEGNEQQAAEHYRRAISMNDAAGAHVNLGNLYFLQNDYAAAITEYGRAQKKDPSMAIAFYNNSVASGETYKFDEQGQKLEQAKKIDREYIEQLSQNPPSQKIAMYSPSVRESWQVASAIARRGVARSLFGNYSWFDPIGSGTNPVTIGALASLLLALMVWAKRRRAGFAGSCIKCGRTFCHRCKSARESATYCTQCIHIYLKRDGVALATKRSKLEEVSDHQAGVQRRNKLFATFLPGSAQLLEGRTLVGVLGMVVFFICVAVAIFVGRLAPALGPVAQTAQLGVRVLAIALAVIIWFLMSVPVYRRRVAA
jgi:tetratricopeptide (TPR) repeat protein